MVFHLQKWPRATDFYLLFSPSSTWCFVAASLHLTYPAIRRRLSLTAPFLTAQHRRETHRLLVSPPRPAGESLWALHAGDGWLGPSCLLSLGTAPVQMPAEHETPISHTLTNLGVPDFLIFASRVGTGRGHVPLYHLTCISVITTEIYKHLFTHLFATFSPILQVIQLRLRRPGSRKWSPPLGHLSNNGNNAFIAHSVNECLVVP